MITIEQEPIGYRPVYNDDFFVVSSTNYTQPNFQYVCDVYVNGNYITRTKTFAHPTNSYGLFNPKRIVESYLSKDFNLSNTLFQQNTNSYCYYQLRFGEEFGLDSSGTTIYPNQALSSTLYVWNGIYDFIDYVSFDETLHILNASDKKFLTNAPDGLKIQTNEKDYLYGITTSSGDIYFLNVTTFDSAGAQIDSYQIANPYQAVSSNNDKFFRVGVGAANLNTLTLGDVYYTEFGNFPIIGSNVYRYNVQVSKFNSTVTSETRTYYIHDICTKTETSRLFFLNKLGGYDAFTFKHKAKINADIKRSSFKKPQGSWNGTTFNYNIIDRADTQYDTNIKDTITLVSDYVTEAEGAWLEELFTSPDVYIRTGSSTYVPINITATSFETKQTAVAKLINFTIEYTYSYNRYRQRF